MTFRHYQRAAALAAAAVSTGIAGSGTREGNILWRALSVDAPAGQHVVFDRGVRTDARTAAFWNGSLIHCSDYDDTHQTSVVHPSAPVLPAALVAAERSGATVGDFVIGYACGLEAVTTLASATPGAYHREGFHATAVCGPVGAAVAAAVIGGADRATVENAALISAMYSGGTFEYINGGGNGKITYPGHAARIGIDAVAMAGAGLAPPPGSIDGRFGLVPTHTAGERALAWHPTLPEVLDETDLPEFCLTAIKSYPCCYFSQVFLDGIVDLMGSHDWPSADYVVEVVCEGPQEMIQPIFEPEAARRRPSDGYEAKFALPYQIGSLLVHGGVGLETFAGERLTDPAVLSLAARVRGVATEELGSYPMSMPGRVTIAFADGSTVQTVRTASAGAAQWGLDSAELRDRIRRDLGSDLAEQLLSVFNEPNSPVINLTSLLHS